MKRKNATRSALFTSIISLLLCVSMLVGTTFAWFTDSVSSGKNQIVAGNLDVELYYQVEGRDDWTKVTEDSNIFKENTLWEPGHTEVVKLKVVNEGTLALKYRLGVNVAGETGSKNVAGTEFKLSDFIKFGIVEGDWDYTREQAVAAVDATASALNTAYSSEVIKLLPKTEDNTDNEDIVTMVVYMPESIGNEANYGKGEAVPTINLGINLLATQVEYEEDSFDDQYDKDAAFTVTVSNAEELIAVLSEVKARAKQQIPGENGRNILPAQMTASHQGIHRQPLHFALGFLPGIHAEIVFFRIVQIKKSSQRAGKLLVPHHRSRIGDIHRMKRFLNRMRHSVHLAKKPIAQ